MLPHLYLESSPHTHTSTPPVIAYHRTLTYLITYLITDRPSYQPTYRPT